MTEREKMLSGALYDASDPELAALRKRARRLMRAFLHAQQRMLRLHPDLAQLIRQDLRLINRSVLYDDHVRESFLEILNARGNVAPTLRSMHEVGLLGKYLPEFGDREKERVTVRHLLTHSSGLKPWRAFHELLLEKERKTGERWLATQAARELVLERVLRSGLVHEPGAAAVYGDLDFIALGALVEAVTQRRLDDVVRERITVPLGLSDTFFVPLGEGAGMPDALRHRTAATENCPWRERILWGEVHDPNAWAMGGVAGHAGLFATADDLMRFAGIVLDVWHGRSDALPRELLRAFATRQRMPEKSDWALGWDTPTAGASSSGKHFSANSIGHLGFTGTSIWIDLERECTVVMLTNRVHQVAKRSKFDLRPEVHDAIREAFEAGWAE